MAFSFPSLHQITEQLLLLLKRFPFVALVSLIGTAVAVWFAGLDYETQKLYPNAEKLIFICVLGISFLFSIATFLEQAEWNRYPKLIANISGIVLLIVYYYLIGDKWEKGPAEVWYRYALFIVASHLLVAFAPFFSKGKLDSFWEYNKALFLRVLLSVLYSGVLFAGLSIALLSIDNLLGLDVKDERYLQLFFFLGGIFNTWFFLAGVPGKDSISDKQLVFPKGLKVFVQFVLIPLISVYIFILYLYLIKIIVEWQLPNGWVANLVLSFSIAGILSLLLLFPIRESSEHKWIRFYSKGYYLALIPLIGLLMLSIWVRISDYGVTINRYYVATLGVWLTGMVFYFILSNMKSIKVIPISLCIVALLTSFGPLGAFAVSERSQTGRFEEILLKNDMLDEQGMAIPKKEGREVSFADRKQLSSSVGYLLENHGVDHLQDYFEQDLTSMPDTISTVNINSRFNASKIIQLLGIEYVEDWQVEETGDFANPYFEFTYSSNEAIDIREYDFSVTGLQFYAGTAEKTFSLDDIEWTLIKNEDEKNFELVKNDMEYSIEILYESFQEKLFATYSSGNDQAPFRDMNIISENEYVKVLSVFSFFSGNVSDGGSLSSVKLNLYIKEK